jgi:RHS repeat-associated protein
MGVPVQTRLVWERPPKAKGYDIQQYEVQWKKESASWRTASNRSSASTSSYVGGRGYLDAPATYQWRVRARGKRAVTDRGDALTAVSDWSAPQTFTTRQMNPPRTPEGDGVVKVEERLRYDNFGRLIWKKNARGETIEMEYKQAGKRLSKVEMTGLGGGLSVRYRYDEKGRLRQMINEAGGTRRFAYDAFGRLTATLDENRDTVTTHDYLYSDGNPTATPNLVETVQKGGFASPDVVKREVLDGLGRSWQEVTELAGEEMILQTTTYDDLGRKKRAYRPYEDTGPGFDANKTYERGVVPFTATDYENNPLDRPEEVDPPAEGAVQKTYGVERSPFRAKAVLPGYESHVFRYVQTAGEEGQTAREGADVKRVYRDGLGRKVMVVNGYNSADEAVTYFRYDDAGRLTAVVRPAGDSVTYAYDGRGQQTSRTSPDAGTTRRLYDAAGTVRFVQNAAQAEQGVVQYTCTDGAGRPLESGVAPLSDFEKSSFFELEAAQSCEAPSSTRTTVKAYDAPPDAGGDPWSNWAGWADGRAAPPLARSQEKADAHLEGRLAARAHRTKESEQEVTGTGTVVGPTVRSASKSVAVKTGIGDSMRVTAGDEVRLGPGFSTEEDATFRATVDTSQSTAESAETPDWRLTFLRYDREGQVTRKDAFVPGLGQVTYTYRYDRQERLTRRRVHLRRAGQTVHQWYEYDRRGQVRAVYASRDSVKPKSPEVAYRYAADGQVEETTWKGGPSFSRAYNRRGWLTAIGTVDSSQAFAARYRYFPDGNVKAVTASPKTYSTFTRTYRYDALDRLTSADYGADGLGGEYDVTDLTYDPNGNITGLTRYGRNEPNVDDSVLVDRLSYDRYEGNRLMHVHDAAGRKTPWDAGSGRFAYDPAGRMLRSPAPMGLAAAAYDEQGLPETMALKNEADVRFRYTAGGQRTYKQVDGGRGTHYVRDGSVPVAVVDGGRLRYWTLTLPGGEGIGRMPAGGGRRYYVTDHLGSIRAVLDGGGNVKETRDYYPFGLRMPGRTTQKSPTETEEDFTGHVKDDATGLHYAGARYYSSAFGRWTTTEPLLQSKSPKKLLKNKPRLLTRTSYNYTFNNPINLRDPTGKVACGGLCTAALGTV